jgi:hypothetical protein
MEFEVKKIKLSDMGNGGEMPLRRSEKGLEAEPVFLPCRGEKRGKPQNGRVVYLGN